MIRLQVDTTTEMVDIDHVMTEVVELANALGGTWRASHAPDGGAATILTFPLDTPRAIGPFVPRLASDALPIQHESQAARLVAPGVAQS